MKLIIIIITRILCFIPFFLLSFVGAFFLFVTWMFNYIRYGGEAIAYTKRTKRKTIQDVFNKLNEKL